ncbi:MAG: DUF177 domain-containing protein [Chlamydiae bacterium]|nr:DUF177 domain-containing protein [Chlamydiota bacterium]MBI3266738.1 DUF177 domain-containing protein [Chlamydiota bacterium]
MKVYVDRIPEEGLLLEGEESGEIVDMGEGHEKFSENILVRLHVYKVSGKLIVTGSLSTHALLSCGRCLEVFSYLIDNKKFTYDCDIEGRDIIDLTEPVREDIIIGLPVRPLCREGCRGLCNRCGQNLNVKKCKCDFRTPFSAGPFDVLDDLLEKKNLKIKNQISKLRKKSKNLDK